MFLVAAALNVIGSADPQLSGLEFLRTAAAVVMFFVVDRILEQTDRPDRILKAVYVSAIIPVFLGLVGPLVGIYLVESKDRIERITSTFCGANAFSYYLVFLGLMAFGLALYARPRWRVPLLGPRRPPDADPVLTYTRTAWIAFAAGLLVVGGYTEQEAAARPGRRASWSACCSCRPSRTASRSSGATTRIYTYRRDSLEWRIAYWTDIIPLANSNPVTGIGLKMTSEVSDKLPHNDYLRSYVEMGLVGLAAFIVMLVAMIRTPCAGAPTVPDGPLQRGILLGFLAISVALAVSSMADNLINQVVVLWYVFALGGLRELGGASKRRCCLRQPRSRPPNPSITSV